MYERSDSRVIKKKKKKNIGNINRFKKGLET